MASDLRAPVRIQRRRSKGWRMPDGAVYVGRPTMWGNRWKIGVWSNTLARNVETIEEAVDLYRRLMWPEEHHRNWCRECLRGRDRLPPRVAVIPAPRWMPKVVRAWAMKHSGAGSKKGGRPRG